MLAPLGFSCPRCLLLRRVGGGGGGRWAIASLARQLADKTPKDIVIPPEPTTCCMSGCANCVWLDYAQTLTKLLDGNDERARELVLSKITDPNLKMFLSLELRQMKLLHEEKPQPPAAGANEDTNTPKTPSK
ncbi:oxidoreductase-like domain-containing protein 1 [Drosophila guanche]|uniref:Blast:Oxidoreductase-like domain-containing protein 1 n=1 Tax=Drosophila guanche TaxID=7266 RepID=A0A3B0K532_DROGU|nr:oxidoreductase-like domain-containing protein 1 [Drosophila guanche]SPP81109.1 blast:Oxidoreductase-like domain-containing protein 1 [Drosophila guanche]